MKDIINNLNLTNDTIDIFLECMGKIPLTYEEIHSIKPHLSDEEFKIIFDDLIKKKLLVNVVPENSLILKHYLAIPPFSAIFTNLMSDKEAEESNDITLKSNIKNKIMEIFNDKDNPIELDSILNELKMMKQNFENDSSEFRKEIYNTLDSMQTRDDSALFYLNFEENVKRSINSQFASILEIILQIDAQSDDIPGIKNLTEEQWDIIKQDLKNLLAKSVHEKAKELDKSIGDNFREIKDYFGSKLAISMEEQIGQKAVDLGILKIVIEELSSLFEFISNKSDSNKKNLESLSNLIGDKLISNFNDLIKENFQKIKNFEQLLPEILETYFSIENVWRIKSITKIREEILNIIEKSNDNIVILVPKIKDYIPFETLKNSKNNNKITIIASDSHESEIIGEIRSYPNVEYLRIEKNKTIGIIGAGILIIGYYQLNKKDLSKIINALGTIDESLIDLLSPIIINKIQLGKPPARVQMNNNFNYINININNIVGNEISQKLQENLDIATTLKGISLNILELKLLISKLKKLKSPIIDNVLKKSVIEKIRQWNEEYTSLSLEITPEFKLPDSKELIEAVEVLKDSQLILSDNSKSNFEIFDLEKIQPLFEILFEKIDNTKGEELSKIIQDVIDTVLQILGFSIIRTWKENLGSEENKEKLLEEDLKNKFIEDFTRWKNAILNLKQTDKTQLSKDKSPKELSIDDEIDLSGYTSPGMIQEQHDNQTPSTEESELSDGGQLIDKIKNAFDEIYLNLNEFDGINISKKLQIFGDLLVEKHGYMATKDIRPWVGKLKKYKDPLDDDIKNQFSNILTRIKELYIGESEEEIFSDYVPSFAHIDGPTTESDPEVSEDNKLLELFNKVKEDSNILKGYELTGNLQEIADIVMQSKGALEARSIRPWISKLRAIRDPLEEEIKAEFAQYIETMKEKFC